MARLPNSLRRESLAFLLHVAHVLKARRETKHCALMFFGHRFLYSMESLEDEKIMQRASKRRYLQLIGLASFWIASKIHETRPTPLMHLEEVANKLITDVHFTKRDFVEAEILLLKAIKFELGFGVLLCDVVEELVQKFRKVATVGRFLEIQTSFDIIDLLYDCEELNIQNTPSNLVAASIVAVTYTLSVKTKMCNFPILPWLIAICKGHYDEIRFLVQKILLKIFKSNSDTIIDEDSTSGDERRDFEVCKSNTNMILLPWQERNFKDDD